MITATQALTAAAGGALIGTSATVMLALSGRVAGISGIVGGLLKPRGGDIAWRAAFLGGLILAGFALVPVLPGNFLSIDRPLGVVVVAGLLVGFGTRLGNGCTSGHGVCGMARLSPRSFAAVGVFLTTGIVVATVAGQLLGGV